MAGPIYYTRPYSCETYETARIINPFANPVILSPNCRTRGQHLSRIPHSAKIIETNLLTVAG